MTRGPGRLVPWDNGRSVNAGERYDALLEATNPGTWMLHCHNLGHVGEGSTGMTGLTMTVVVAP